MCFSCICFVYFARANFCPFSLPLCVEGWLRIVLVVLPGLFLLTVWSPSSHRLTRGSTDKKFNEPAHEIMALVVLRKLFLQTRVRSHPVRRDVI